MAKLKKAEIDEDGLARCPFCGSKVDFMTLVTGIKMFYCRNHRRCGAIVSFDTDNCNREKGDANKIAAWNRRTT